MSRALKDRVDFARSQLTAVADDPTREALMIVAHVHNKCSVQSVKMNLDHDDGWGAAQENHFFDCVAQRQKGRPIAKIRGYKSFWNHDFFVNDHVLDPRPDTELLVEIALKLPFETVLDIGVGSGAILISLLDERPMAAGVGGDISDDALSVAQSNADQIGVSDRVQLILSDVFSGLGSVKFDLIVSNPPYISQTEMQDLSVDVLHDPHIALTDDGDGLSFYRAIATQADDYLTENGCILVEFGAQQAQQVAQIFSDSGFKDQTLYQDLNGHDRVMKFTKIS